MGIDLLFIESHGSRDKLFVGTARSPAAEKLVREPGHIKVLLLALCLSCGKSLKSFSLWVTDHFCHYCTERV